MAPFNNACLKRSANEEVVRQSLLSLFSRASGNHSRIFSILFECCADSVSTMLNNQ